MRRIVSPTRSFARPTVKAIRVEVIVDPSRAAVANKPLTARLAPAPPVNSRAAQSATVSAAGGSATQQSGSRAAGAAGGGARRGTRGGRGAAKGGRERAPERPKATLESLDAEMSDWQAQVSAAAPAAGAAGGEATA